MTDTDSWRRSFDAVDPIRVRDPVAEALGVLPPGEPFAVEYADVVTVAGHSCPAAAGAFRVAETGLDALYPDALPVRSEVAVQVGGAREDHPIGVIGRLLSVVTGAAGEDGFRGLADGYGGRENMLGYAERGGEGLRFAFQRTDTDRAVEVAYDIEAVPDLGPAKAHLPEILEGTADEDDREAFEAAWHGRVEAVLTGDDLFATEQVEPFA
ncbi:MAG: hypothetical protein ABEJ77_03345 [Halanaeroarchaeum sp.]